MQTLAQLPISSKAIVIGLQEHNLKIKLLEMGLYIGKEISVLFKAPFGDPIAVDVGGYVLSMRLNEAQLVHIEIITE